MTAFLTNLLSLILSTVVLLIIIGVLVFVHELGHFLAAKFCGVKVNEFAIGFGKKLWSKEYKGTLYRINLLPLGGFVAMEGEDGTVSKDPGNYNNKPWAAKAFILMGGILMNTLLAVILFAIFLPIINYRVVIRNESPFNFTGADKVDTGVLITKFDENSVVAGKLEVLDLVYQTQGERIVDSATFQKSLADNQGKEYNLKARNLISGQEKDVTVTLPVRQSPEQRILGIGFVPHYIVYYPQNAISAVSHSWNIFAYQLQVIAGRFQMAFQQRDASIVSDQLGSVVAVGVIVEDLLSNGQTQEIINLIALVSLSLAFFNLLPIPALDGGHLLVVSLESITRRKFNRRLLNTVNQTGFIILMGLGFLVIFKDVIQFEILQRLANWLGSIIPR